MGEQSVTKRMQLQQSVKSEKGLRQGGIEPPAKPWKGFMLPLHH